MTSRSVISALFAVVMVASSVGAPVVAAAPPAGPVAEWTFDEASGGTATDVVGSLDGTLGGGVGRTTTDVPQGTGALVFDGDDDIVTIADDPLLKPADDFSLALWFKGEEPTIADVASLVKKGDYGCNRQGAYELQRSGSDAYWWNTHTSLQGYAAAANAPDVWFDNEWHLAVMTWNDATDTLAITVDGLAGTTTLTGPDEMTYTNDDQVDGILRIGNDGSSCESHVGFAGAIDDVRLWHRALPRSEILAMLPTEPTTTTIKVLVQNAWELGSDESMHTVFVDDHVVLEAFVDPKPGTSAAVTWFAKKDGEPEMTLGSMDLIVHQYGDAFAYLPVDNGTLDEGHWTLRAEWAGADNWPASESASWSLDVVRRTVDMTLQATTSALLPGESTTLQADASMPKPNGTNSIPGTVSFYETTGTEDVLLGSASLGWQSGSIHRASFQVSSVSEGTHTYEARYEGSAIHAPATASTSVTAGTQDSWIGVWFTPNPTLHTSAATAHLSVSVGRHGSDTAALPAPTGTVSLRTSPAGTLIATVPIGSNTFDTEIVLPVLAAGSHDFVASYSGDTNFEPSTSDPATLTVASDIVEAFGIGIQYTTFYPLKDGYRDTVAVRGTRQEPASVSIRVYAPTGKRVKSASIAMAYGPYSFAWNGRSSDGTVLAAGKYKVVQVLKDGAGVTRTVTGYVNLSHKKLYTYTKTFTKDYTQVSKKTSTWVGWRFTLPSATVYKGLRFSIYGKDSVGSGGFGPHDFSQCGTGWTPACVSRSTTFPTTFEWKSVAGSASKDRSGTTVRLYAWGGAGNTRITYGRVKVSYAILK